MSDEIIDALDFEKHIEGMQDRQLLEFVARQTFETCQRCIDHDTRISFLEGSHKKTASMVGGATGAFTAVIISIINYFVGVNHG